MFRSPGTNQVFGGLIAEGRDWLRPIPGKSRRRDRRRVQHGAFALTLCAECGLVAALHAAGPANPAALPALQAVAVVRATVGRCCRAAAAVSSCSKPAAAACWSTPRTARWS